MGNIKPVANSEFSEYWRCLPVRRLTAIARQASAEIASSSRWPGTMVIGTGKVPACLPASVVTSGPGPFLVGAGGEDEDGDVLVLLDQLDDLLGAHALADHLLRLDVGLLADEVGHLAERVLGLIDRLGAHDVLDADPLLELARGDDVEEHQTAAGALRPARGKEQRPAAPPGYRR